MTKEEFDYYYATNPRFKAAVDKLRDQQAKSKNIKKVVDTAKTVKTISNVPKYVDAAETLMWNPGFAINEIGPQVGVAMIISGLLQDFATKDPWASKNNAAQWARLKQKGYAVPEGVGAYGSTPSYAVNNQAFINSKKDRDITAQNLTETDIAANPTMFNDWNKFTPEQQQQVAQKEVDLNLVDENHGGIDIKGTPGFNDLWNTVTDIRKKQGIDTSTIQKPRYGGSITSAAGNNPGDIYMEYGGALGTLGPGGRLIPRDKGEMLAAIVGHRNNR